LAATVVDQAAPASSAASANSVERSTEMALSRLSGQAAGSPADATQFFFRHWCRALASWIRPKQRLSRSQLINESRPTGKSRNVAIDSEEWAGYVVMHMQGTPSNHAADARV